MKPQPPTDTLIFITRESFVGNDYLMAAIDRVTGWIVGILRGAHVGILRRLFINGENFRAEMYQYHVLVR